MQLINALQGDGRRKSVEKKVFLTNQTDDTNFNTSICLVSSTPCAKRNFHSL